MRSNVRFNFIFFIKLFLLNLIFIFNHAFAEVSHNLPFAIHSFKTPEGLSVQFVHEASIPIVVLELGFHAGSSYDSDQWGLADFVAQSIGKETNTESGDQLAWDLDNSGAEIAGSVDRDLAVFTMHSQVQPALLNPAIHTLVQIISQMTTSNKIFNQITQNQIQNIKISLSQPLEIAENALMANLFSGTSYAHSIHGTLDRLNTIAPGDVMDFYHEYYVDQNGYLVIVGDIDLAEAQTIASEFSSALPSGRKASMPELNSLFNPAPVLNNANGNNIHIDFPSKQTVILMGQRSMGKTDPLNLPLLTGLTVLAGPTMESVLYNNLKVGQNLVYNISADMNTWSGAGVLSILTETDNQNAQAVESGINQAIGNLLQSGPSQTDLEHARNYLAGSFQLGFSSDQNLADMLLTMMAYGFPENYLNKRAQDLLLLAPSNIAQAFTHIAQNNNPWVTVTVGGAS